ncbi:MAG: cation-transporting P-type ATPase [Anaerolineales bacterium]
MEQTRQQIHRLLRAEVYAALETGPEGLSDAQVQERLARYGRNVLREVKGKPLILRFLANFTHVMALLLWAGGIVGFVAQMPQLAIAIWSVNIINGVFGFWQEYRAEKATEALRQMLPVNVRVMRSGVERSIPAEELVPGDVMILSEGDRISADGRLVEDAELTVDQSTFTGESHPVRKLSEAVLSDRLKGADLPNLVFAGTNVSSGSGKAVVFATGMETEFGKIASLTQGLSEELSPLQREMKVVTRNVTFIAVSVGILFFLISVWAAGMRWSEAFIFAMGMIVAFVPEGLLPTVTLSLAMGVQRIAKRNALVKRLSSVETLGCTTVICTDKTGTLTQNEMTVTDLYLNGRALQVTGVGYAPEGAITEQGRTIAATADQDVALLLTAASLCNDARLLPPTEETPRWTILGDPTEAALKVVAAKAGLGADDLAVRYPRVRVLPFDSRRKRMATIHQVILNGMPTRLAFVKGAPRETLDLCTTQWTNGHGVPLDDEARTRVLEMNDRYARAGLRVLAVAYRQPGQLPAPQGVGGYTAADVERDLTFLGLVAMMDPARPEVSAAVAQAHHAGIRIIMITGDYGLTAESIARRIGIVGDQQVRVITGAELDGMTDAQLDEAAKEDIIFARVSPEHKLRVVQWLQAAGHVVAMTGDGVNDAPALKRADIGIVMGLTGTDVAKEAADMILTDDSFASIVHAIEEGRAVYANIKKFATYVFTSNTPEAVPFVLYALTGGRIPLALNVMHVLSIDLGTDMVPALALGAEPPEPGLMDRPPRKLSEHIITRGMLFRAYGYLGIVQGAAAMFAFYARYWLAGYWGQWLDLPGDGTLYRSATSMALAAVVATQIGNLFAQRSERRSAFRLPLRGNPLLWVGIASEVALVLAIVYVPFMQRFIGTGPIPPHYWLLIIAWTPALLLADELRKVVLNLHDARKLKRQPRSLA